MLLKPRADVTEDAEDWHNLHVVVLGWSPAKLSREEPAGLAEIVRHFGGIERYLDICLERFCLWTPGQEEFDKLLFRLKHASVRRAGAAIRDGLATCRRKLVPGWAFADVPQDLTAALKRLGAAPSSSDRKQQSGNEAWKDFQQLFDDKCVAPWLAELEDTDDAVERNLLLLGATTGGMAQMQAIRMFCANEIPPDA